MACNPLYEPLLKPEDGSHGLGLEFPMSTMPLSVASMTSSVSSHTFAPSFSDQNQHDFQDTAPLFVMLNQQYNDSRIPREANNFPLGIEYKKYPSKFFKTQKRARGKSQQRIEAGDIQIVLDFKDIVTFDLLCSIQIFVQRINELPSTPQYVGAVPLQAKYTRLGQTKQLIEVNLDSVYEYQGHLVYKLQKTLTEELNTFRLLLNVRLQDGREKIIKTKEFLLVGKKNIPGEKRPYEKRIRLGSTSSNDSAEPLCKSPGLSPGLSSGYQSHNEDEDLFRAQRIVTNHIETKSMEVGGILVNNIIQSPNGDIAYHFPIDNVTEKFEEGETVGLIHDTVNNRLNIVKLTAGNAVNSVLKGVITRSQYFEAMKPTDRTLTETICMMGIVPVKIKGSLEVNEPIYASPYNPGVAISGYHLSYEQMNESALVGYAFQSVAAKSEEQISMAQAGVSVLNCASQMLLNKRIRDMEFNWNQKINKLQRSNKRFRRCFMAFGIIAFVVILLTGIYLWQLLTPGSAYRYYLCKQGQISGHTATFKFNPGIHVFNLADVNGIEFEFSDLMKKTGHNYKQRNATGTRYYLNIDRCAYGGIRSTHDVTTGQKRVYGPDVFAVDGNCKTVYSYFEADPKWREYDSSHNIHNLHCLPKNEKVT